MPRAPHRRPEMADRAQREHQRDAGFGVRPGGALATLAGATVGVVVTSRGSRGAFSRPERGGAVPLLERARSHAMAPMAEERVRPATRGDASARAHSRRFDVGQDTVAMAFPTRSRASSAMVSRRSGRPDVSNPPSRLSTRAIRGPRLARPGLVARTRDDARRPENGIIRPFHRSPRLPPLAGCGSQARPYARSASEPTLPEAETARRGGARTHRAGQDGQDLAQGARATPSRARPLRHFFSKRINPFWCHSDRPP